MSIPCKDRWTRLSIEEQARIGGQVKAARASGMSWKVLEHVYQRTRRRLWTYVQLFDKGQISQQDAEITHQAA